MVNINIGEQWKNELAPYFESEQWQCLKKFLEEESKVATIYPSMTNVFSAFEFTDFDMVKVVIIGQDPYHGPKQANGLSFSVTEGQAIPPSLRNIFKELESDLGIQRKNPDLSDWARQGVLLMNRILSVREGEAGSHQNCGWEQFSDYVLQKLNESQKPIVFIFWGKYAQQLQRFITNPIHKQLVSAHPSPLSAHRGFFGSRPFSEVNNFLVGKGYQEIEW
ncbi:MAG: uracil-DNA glycosylase [Culicoidibacterales bacterium]